RVVASYAGVPRARRGKAVPRICPFDRRGRERPRRSIITAAVTSETTPMFIIPWQEAMAANAARRLQIRIATDRDLDRLVEYFRTLSRSSRYNRFMEPDSNFANFAFQRVTQSRGADRFILIVEAQQQGRGAIIGEASYALDSETGRGEFALPVGDACHG